MTAHLQKNWWLLTLRGVLALLLGIIAVISPGLVLFTLLIFMGSLALVSGIFLIVEGIAIKGHNDRFYRITEGLIDIILGLIILLLPGPSLQVIMIIIALWAIAIGIFQIASAVKLRKVIVNEWMAILNGIITLIFGILLLTNLIAGAQVIIIVIGFFYIFSGLLMIFLSLRLKALMPV
jgi:uncharacterized membrane protein HdeD (DUF308 family)